MDMIITTLGYYIGGSVEFLLNPNSDKSIYVQADILYSKLGNRENVYDSVNVFKLDQVNIPIVLKYSFFNKFYVAGGGYLGYVVNAKELSGDTNTTRNIYEDYHKFDSGLIIGLQYKFKSGLFIESRYLFGLSNISKVEFPDFNTIHVYKNRIFQIGIGYIF